jgi:uncharacterized protein YggE
MKFTFGLLFILLTSAAFGQTGQELEVRGYGRLKAQPDLCILYIELKTIQKEFGTTVSVLTSDYEKIIKHLEKEGFKKEDIKTSNYGVQGNRIYGRGTFYDSGFVGHQNLSVEFKNTSESLTKITDSFSRSPVKVQFSFSFTISDRKREDFRNELIKRAIQDANQKARLISETSGQQLGKIKKIKYGTALANSGNEPTYERAMVIEVPDEEEIKEQIGFDIKEISFKDYVIIIYELK